MAYFILATLLYLVACLIYFGRKKPGYSHVEHTISELAETGSITEKRVSYSVFLPVGVAAACIAFLTRANEPAFLFGLSLAIGYGVSAFFPIDPCAPPIGSWKNIVHSLAGGISYVLAMAAFEHAGHDIGFPYGLGKFLIFAFLVSLYLPTIRRFRGLLQRIVEGCIFAGWIGVF